LAVIRSFLIDFRFSPGSPTTFVQKIFALCASPFFKSSRQNLLLALRTAMRVHGCYENTRRTKKH